MLSIQAVRGLLAFVHLASFLALSLFLAWYRKKLNLSQQKHAFTNQKKCTTTQNKKNENRKTTKARFSRLLRNPAWKRSGSMLKGKDK